MTIYGLWGFTHGWARVLTVMSPEGISAALEFVQPTAAVSVHAKLGTLTQYHSGSRAALDTLIEKHNIIVLSKPQWDTRKAELGDAIWN